MGITQMIILTNSGVTKAGVIKGVGGQGTGEGTEKN